MLIPVLRRFGSALILSTCGLLFSACGSDGTASTGQSSAAIVTAPGVFSQSLLVQGVLKLAPVVEGCQNHPGPWVTLPGAIELGAVPATLLFANNVKLTHQHSAEISVDVDLVSDLDEIRIPKQPPLGGAGGNPWIYLQLLDSEGGKIGDEILLGRCVQGLSAVDVPLLLDAVATGEVTTGSCANSPGPYITLSGKLALSGIDGVLYFRNNAQGTHEAEEAVSVEFVILPEGESITFNKQPPLGGAGGNPHIWLGLPGLAFPGLYLGRCNQMD